ncbi:MAG: cation diffusion facilitator family transporter [Flavobacteriales bacterium]|jgi:cation diffusion facilitator family transporter
MHKKPVKIAKGAAILSMFGNLVLAIAKGIGGVLGHSDALIADAIESSSDVFSSLLVFFGIRYASKPADENHPYGHGKAEPLFTFIVVGFLLVSAALIMMNGIQNLSEPQPQPESFTLYIIGAIILIKEGFYQIIKRKSVQTNSSVLMADAWHHRSDAITSTVTFIGVAIAVFLGPGYETADDWAAIVASLIIVYNAYRIFRPALGEIMDEHLHDNVVKKIRSVSEKTEGVIGTEKCFVRKTGMVYHVDLHLIVAAEISVKEGHTIAHNTKDNLQETIPELADILIHIEPNMEEI